MLPVYFVRDVPGLYRRGYPPSPLFLFLFILKEFRFFVPVSVLDKGVTDGFYGCAHSKGVSWVTASARSKKNPEAAEPSPHREGVGTGVDPRKKQPTDVGGW